MLALYYYYMTLFVGKPLAVHQHYIYEQSAIISMKLSNTFIMLCNYYD